MQAEVAKERKIVVTTKPKRAQLLALPRRTHGHNISLSIVFKGKMKLGIIFIEWIERVTNLRD